MVGTKGRYYCTRRSNYYDRYECNEPLVIGRIVEPLTWNYILDLIRFPDQFEERLRQAQANEYSTMEPKRRELKNVQALLADTEEEADGLVIAIRQAKGRISEKLKQQEDEVNQRYEALQSRMAKLQGELKLELTDQSIANILRFREIVADGLDNPTFEDKRRWLEILQVTVTVTNRQAVIACRLPIEPIPFDLANPDGYSGQAGTGIGQPYEFGTSASLPKVPRKK
jgi:hypothetical protein